MPVFMETPEFRQYVRTHQDRTRSRSRARSMCPVSTPRPSVLPILTPCPIGRIIGREGSMPTAPKMMRSGLSSNAGGASVSGRVVCPPPLIPRPSGYNGANMASDSAINQAERIVPPRILRPRFGVIVDPESDGRSDTSASSGPSRSLSPVALANPRRTGTQTPVTPSPSRSNTPLQRNQDEYDEDCEDDDNFDYTPFIGLYATLMLCTFLAFCLVDFFGFPIKHTNYSVVTHGLTSESLDETFGHCMEKFDKGSCGFDNFDDVALNTAGARVVSTRNTSFTGKIIRLALFDFPLIVVPNTADVVIKPGITDGDCWRFDGEGSIVVKIASPTKLVGFRVEHLRSKSDDFTSAPKRLLVYGLTDYENESTGQTHLFGDYMFDPKENLSQDFLPTIRSKTAYQYVELIILSNHGARNTCVYRFRAFGKAEVSVSSPSL